MPKKIAPIIIVSFILVYILFVLLNVLSIPMPTVLSVEFFFIFVAVFVFVCIGIGLIITLKKRLNEIDKEDHDDLSKY